MLERDREQMNKLDTETELNSVYWYWLCNITGCGLVTIHKLLEYFHTPMQIYEECEDENLSNLGIKQSIRTKILESRNLEQVKQKLGQLKERGIRFIHIQQKEYPSRLKQICNPPYGIYVRGNLPEDEKPTIAIVGARECSNYGREIATYYGKALAAQGIQVISGMARGIDGFAHQGAIHEVGKTYAVLGSGIDVVFPQENFNLYMDLIDHGGVLSEYGPGMPGKPGNFPMRNRIISGLSDGILLVEARNRSGSLITVDLGLEQGKNIYACPGRVTDLLSYGSNHIIQQGGKLVMKPSDILEDYGFTGSYGSCNYKKNRNMLETKEKIVYDKLSLIPKHLENILVETRFSLEETTEILLSLQLKGYIKPIAGNYYTCILDDSFS